MLFTMDRLKRICSILFTTKSIEKIQIEAENTPFRRTLGALDLTLIGIGDIIGAGIFVITGNAAANYAGPAVVLSFIFASIACAFTGLCYAELAAMIPISGSAYSYTYAAFGELIAWISGWDLSLEYLIGSALVAQGWSKYFQTFLRSAFDVQLNPNWTHTPLEYSQTLGFVAGQGYIDLPAFLITCLVSTVLFFGVRQTALFNHFFVGLKLAIILLFLAATCGHINTDNYVPFIPESDGEHTYGIQGIFRAAFTVTFSYIGFDAVSTCTAEAKNPQRNMPIGILGSLAVCSLLYVLVALNLTGIANYKDLGGGAPLALAVEGLNMNWLTILISIGAVAGLTSVMTVAMYAQPRVWNAMANDGLIPSIFAKVHSQYKTPSFPIVLNAAIVGLSAAFIPLDVLGDMTASGTLFAFALVCLSVGKLRISRPDIKRPFRVPLGPVVVPGLGVATCLFLLTSGGVTSVVRLFIWMAIGLVVYAGYGFRHSKLRACDPDTINLLHVTNKS